MASVRGRFQRWCGVMCADQLFGGKLGEVRNCGDSLSRRLIFRRLERGVRRPEGCAGLPQGY
eukprot:8846743-Alexandrium_andersonii.AAC.2